MNADIHWGECQRHAVAAAYEVPFESTPAVLGQSKIEVIEALDQWATGHGLRWWESVVVAPVGLKRWVAHLWSPPHAVVFGHAAFWRDPGGIVSTASLERVETARWLLPADQNFLAGGNKLAPLNGSPDGVELAAAPAPGPANVNQTMHVFRKDVGLRHPRQDQQPNRAARRAAARRRS